jgi:hypothetical protein
MDLGRPAARSRLPMNLAQFKLNPIDVLRQEKPDK